MGLIKRFDRSMDPKIDREFDQIIKQLPHKDDIKTPVTLLNKPITADDKNSLTEGLIYFNGYDNKIYLKANGVLLSLTATAI